jgi:hypothetical protein
MRIQVHKQCDNAVYSWAKVEKVHGVEVYLKFVSYNSN